MDCFENLEPVIQNLDQSGITNNLVVNTYASVYKIKYNSDFVFVYVQYSEQFPKFKEFIAASKCYFNLRRIQFCDKLFIILKVVKNLQAKLLLTFLRTNVYFNLPLVKEQCEIDENHELELRDDKECKIPNETIFGHFIRYVYTPDTFFTVTTIIPAKNDQQVIAGPQIGRAHV